MGVSIAAVLGGYLLRLTGFTEGMANQGETVMFWIRFWEIGVHSALCLVSIYLLTKYPLTEGRAYQVKGLLAARKAGLKAHVDTAI